MEKEQFPEQDPAPKPRERTEGPILEEIVGAPGPSHSTARSNEEDEEQDGLSDTILTNQSSHYLIKLRVENLQEKIDKSFDELIELQDIESILACFDTGEAHDPTPSLELRKLAILEARRVNLPDSASSRFDDDVDDGTISNMDSSYMELLKASWLNPKSIILITNQGKEVGKDVFRAWNFYRIFPPNPPRIKFEDWLDQERKKTGKQEYSATELWQIKSRWLNYCEERVLHTSSCQQAVSRIIGAVTSPIYDGMTKTKKREFNLQDGIMLRETDKTFIFRIPFAEFADIPSANASAYLTQYLAYLQVSFILPEYAQERTRYFTKKGACLKNYLAYLDNLEVTLSTPLRCQLETLSIKKKLLRVYRECFISNDGYDSISGYFISLPQNTSFAKLLETMRREIIQSHGKAIVRHVGLQSTWYPEWMRKLGGLIIDPIEEKVDVKCESSESVYYSELEDHIMQGMFAPSKELIQHATQMSSSEFADSYVAEMRQVYQKNTREFIQYATVYCEQKQPPAKNVFSTGANYLEVLDAILRRVYEDQKLKGNQK